MEPKRCTPRILFLGNNWVGWQVLQWLKNQGEEIVGLVVHPKQKQKYGEEIIDAAALDSLDIFDGSTLHQAETIEAIRVLQPDLGLSVFFGHILKEGFLSLFPQGCINLHPAYLPYNRGQYPNVWSIVEDTPAGASLHYIDAGIDTGAIIGRRKVDVEPIDTGKTLYHKLERASVDLLIEMWPQIRSGQATKVVQDSSEGTYHRTKDVERIDEIDLDETYTARDLINILRACTFPPYSGAYFVENGKRIYLRLELLYEEEL